MVLQVELKLFCELSAHGREDVQGASRQRGLAAVVTRNRSLRNRVLRRCSAGRRAWVFRSVGSARERNQAGAEEAAVRVPCSASSVRARGSSCLRKRLESRP